MDTSKKLLYAGLGAIAAVYVMGVNSNSKELSDKLDPVRAGFDNVVKTVTPDVTTGDDGKIESFNYHNALDKYLATKNQFAKDNGAIALNWRAHPAQKYNRIKAWTNTPGPVALNPLHWNKIDVSSLKPYKK
jgi:hypothetical protein